MRGLTDVDNPYRHALDGLDLADPVRAFFDWCIEREAIRKRRAAGDAPPWTDDPVFQKGRFLNVFREDDPGTKAVLRFAEPARSSIPDLVRALFFARWCNQASTLNALMPNALSDTEGLRIHLLEHLPQPWASDVYPMVPAQWEGHTYERLDACLQLFPKCTDFLVASIHEAQGDVISATDAINARFKMTNNFPIFMALVDLALFEPERISPNSQVPTGIGAAPYLDRLQKHLGMANHQDTADEMVRLQASAWPEARRTFTPVDIEYLSCECRKYYSYVNGTKSFEGKNLFIPHPSS